MPRLTPPHFWSAGPRDRSSGVPGRSGVSGTSRNGDAGGQARSDRLGFGVPVNAHPLVAPAEWGELARLGTPLHWVVLNVARGPGTRPDALYTEAVTRVRESGVPVLGHLDARLGERPFGELVSEASHYLDWYRVDGFYVHRAPTERSEAHECRRLTTTLRALLAGGDGAADGARESGGDGGDGHIVLGHGTHPYPGYAEIADQLVTFSGPWTHYRWSEAPEWTASYPPERFAHLVHGVPRSHLETAMRIARWQGAATVCFTDRTDRDGTDPWEGLAGYWDESVRTLRKQPPPSI
ncbi:spherulation-specific family 4 protein [Streptomyces sp. H10-C2]|uniref:spherulation-specific family 4 protein n=1 Tax=unclassified Streptomyces TaxID=2593676 RepID=UPI0024B900BE|nr:MULTISPECIES: spherulation-specific family 4 protein [unclassified Streptomyces]MDJ0343880.1 spherulation-specific family 4 protein [Streptomyces sp. PH10-H1]MDJ0373469.1 spherulation-specific family 4 protein [Streptomyces sp. H10-C2]